MTNVLQEIIRRHSGPPVNIEGIVKGLGLLLDKKADLEDEISGQLEKLPLGKFKISANKKNHYFRQRFTIAHELGHFLLHSHLIGEGLDDSKAYRSTPDGKFFNENIGRREETEANRFASRILMPKKVVTKHAENGKKVSELATLLQVSTAAMKIRLTSLGYSVESGVINCESQANL